MRLTICFLWTALLLWAQPRIVVDPQRPEQDTVDFGTTLVGQEVSRLIYFVNPTNDTLVLPAPLQPYFSIERTPEQSSDAFDFLEFDARQERFPILVLPRQTRVVRLTFAAIPELYPLGVKVAALRLRLVYYHDTTQVATSRTLVLRGTKVEVRITLSPPLVSADSVFVGRTKDLSVVFAVGLLPPVPAIIDTTVPLRSEIRYRSFPSGTELSAELPTEVPLRSAEIPLRLHYRPEDPGPDTIELRIFYRRYPQAPEEQQSTCLIIGFGVSHQWRWWVESSSPGVRVAGDTVDFGRIRLGNQAHLRLRLRQEGNYRFHASDSLLPQTPEAHGAFSVSPSPFPDTGLAPQAELPLQITFTPHTAGLAELAYTLYSDLGTRLADVPPEARQWHLLLRGVGIGPRLQFLPPSLDIRMPWTPRCPQSTAVTLRLRNIGTDILKIDTLRLATGSAFSIPPLSLPLLLYPEDEVELTLHVEPPTSGEFTDTLFVRTNIPSNSLSFIALHVVAVEPIPITLQLPLLRAKPGSRIWIPLTVDTVPEGAYQCRLVLRYDPSLLRWETFRSGGTALEGADITGVEQGGTLILQARQPYGRLRQRPTLLELGFRVFLGRQISTELTAQQAFLGDTLCPDFWQLHIQSGRVTLDSVCGLEAKLLPAAPLRLELSALPSSSELVVTYEVPVDGELELVLFNAAGLRIQTLWQGWEKAGVFQRRFLLHSISPGVYFCRLRLGELILTRPVLLWQ